MKNPILDEGQGRLRALPRLVLFSLLYALCYGLILMAGALGPGPSLPRYGFGFLILGCLAFAGKVVDRRPLADFGLDSSPCWWMETALGLGLGCLIMGLAFLAGLALGWVEIRALPGAGFTAFAALDGLLAFASLALQEELTHRGYFLRNLAEGFGFPPLRGRRAGIAAWIVGAAIYAVFRLGNPGMAFIPLLNLFLKALMLGLPLLLGGGLGMSLGLRFGWDVAGASLLGFSLGGQEPGRSAVDIIQKGAPWLSGSTYGPEAGLLGTAAIVLGMAAIASYFRLRDGSWLRLREEWSRPREG